MGRGPRVRPSFLAVLAALVLLPAGLALAAFGCFVAALGGIEPGSFLGPADGVEQAKTLLAGFGMSIVGGCAISWGFALLVWARVHRVPSWRALSIAPGVAVVLAFGCAVFTASTP